MNYKITLLALILLSIPAESTLVSLPLVFIFSTLSYILAPEISTIVVSFIAGLFIDSLRVSPPGLSPLFILFTFLIVEILRRGLTFSDYKIVIIFLLISSYAFARILNYSDSLSFYILIAGATTLIISYFNRKNPWITKSSIKNND